MKVKASLVVSLMDLFMHVFEGRQVNMAMLSVRFLYYENEGQGAIDTS